MLRIEHLNLVVRDIPRSLAFYGAALPHWWVRGEGEQDWYGTHRRWLHFGDDYNYLTLNDHGQGENRDLQGTTVGLAHFGLEVSDLDAVVARLAKAGFQKAKPGSDDPHRKNVYFIDPDGFEVEFVEYTSDHPAERNLYRE